MFSYVSILNPGFATVTGVTNPQAGALAYVSFLNPPSTAGGTGVAGAGTAGAITGGSMTVNTSGISVNLPAYLTTAANSTHTHSQYQATGAYLTTAAQVSHSHGAVGFTGANVSGSFTSASNGLSVSLSAAAPGGGGAPNRSYIEIMNGERLTRPWNISASQFSNRPIFQPFWLDGAGLVPSTVRVFWSWVTNTHPPIVTMGAAIYELANATQLTKVCATTQTLNFATTQSAQFTGNRAIDITGMTQTLAEGRKVLAVLFSAANTTNMNASFWGGDNFPNVLGFIAGGNATTASNNTVHNFPFWGVYTANSGTFPDSVGYTQINGGRSADLIDLYAVIKEI